MSSRVTDEVSAGAWTALLAAVVVAAGCTFGAHHQRVATSVDQDDHSARVDGTVDGVDLGVVADFRYFRLGLPYEGQRHEMAVEIEDEGGFDIDSTFELRTLRLDVPVFSFRDFSDDPSGRRYPGRMEGRHSLELWLSGSVGVSPISPVTATAGLTYYRYGAYAARLYGGMSMTPYSGLTQTNTQGPDRTVRREGHAPGIVVGVEMTLAAGEYALELVEFIREFDEEADGRP